MVFYTQIFHAGVNGFTGFPDRYLLTSPDRDTADQLFRGIQENLPLNVSSLTITKLHRLGPQMWTWEGPRGLDMNDLIARINAGITEVKSLKYLGDLNCKTLLLRMYNPNGGIQPVIPSIHLPDHIDGKRFYIRHKHYPNCYWHVDRNVAGDEIYLSTGRRSQFRVSIQNTTVKDAVIVGSDSVSLTYIGQDGGYPVLISREGSLYLHRGEVGNVDYFKFAVFEGGFAAPVQGDKVKLIWGKDDLYNDKRGDEWELC